MSVGPLPKVDPNRWSFFVITIESTASLHDTVAPCIYIKKKEMKTCKKCVHPQGPWNIWNRRATAATEEYQYGWAIIEHSMYQRFRRSTSVDSKKRLVNVTRISFTFSL